MPKLSESKVILLQYAINNGNKISKREAIDLIGHLYENIAKNRIGKVLSYMVNTGSLQRIRNGYFEVVPNRETVLSNALKDCLELLYECNAPDYLFETYSNMIMNYSNLLTEIKVK